MASAVRSAVLMVVFIFLARVAFAQDTATDANPAETARFRFGPLRFTPAISVTNVGIDSNVFNEPTDPRQDTTAAVGPVMALWLNMGPARLSGRTGGQYLYFKNFDNQRAWNTENQLRLELPMARLKPFAAGSYVNTKDRPGFEIDSRSRAAMNTVLLGTEMRVSGKTAFILSGSRATIAFDRDETFLGAELAESLNRRSDTEQLQFRYMLTPLTTLVVTNDAIQDRFETTRTRDADSIRIMPGFEFKPFALISGTVSVGFRHFNALDESIPDFDGVAALVNAKYSVGATQVATRIERDLAFSYDDANPYYALTDINLAVTERVTKTWDVVGRLGWQMLDYRQLESLTTTARTDRGRLYGAGAGYRLGGTFRLGLDVNYAERRSQVVGRQYDGFRVGASVSYGITQ